MTENLVTDSGLLVKGRDSLNLLRRLPTRENWNIVLYRLLYGEFDIYLDRVGGCEEFIKINVRESSDVALAWLEFGMSLEEIINTWQPAERKPGIFLDSILRLISAFTPKGGFLKVLGQLQRTGKFNTLEGTASVERRLTRLALLALENYYPSAPYNSGDDIGFRAYTDFLFFKLGEEEASSYACRRLIELSMLKPSAEELKWVLEKRGEELILELFTHFLYANHALRTPVLSNLYSLCLMFRLIPSFHRVLEQNSCQIAYGEIYGQTSTADLFRPRLVLPTGEQFEIFVPANAENAFITFRLNEGAARGIQRLQAMEAA